MTVTVVQNTRGDKHAHKHRKSGVKKWCIMKAATGENQITILKVKETDCGDLLLKS